MMQKHRISTNIGRDQKIMVELKQDYDLLEILSLKFTQVDAYSSMCSDYGVVVGRISANNGFGLPNARVSIFVPLTDTDELDPVISSLYPYKTVSDRNDENYRYNLLPSRKQHGGHAPTGTFPDQSDILNREEVLEVYEKYYRYTVKTNDSGDFMLWGVPLGTQTLHVDIDLSDIGCFSLRPDDFIRQGRGVDEFKNEYEFKPSDDIDSLPQIVTFNKTIEVYPFWGNEDLCEIGITRSDFDLSDKGIRIEPKAYFIGGTYTDDGKNAVNKNCQPRRKMGRKCDLTTRKGRIEAIRFTSKKDDQYRPILEEIAFNEDIDEDGSFIIPVTMNMDYIYTNEFGENEYTNDPNKGIATSACYRFRISLSDEGLERVRANADYLVPNIREYSNDMDKSYAFSTNYDDYPVHAVENYILNNTDGFYYPQDFFYRLNYNKVYTVSSFHSAYFDNDTFRKDKFLGLKELLPSEEEDCSGSAVTPPVNYGFKNYTFQLLIADVLLQFEHLINLFTFFFTNTLAYILHSFADAVDFWPIRRLARTIRKFAYRFQNSTQRKLYLINYPECEECTGDSEFGSTIGGDTVDYCKVGTIDIYGTSVETPRELSTANDVYFSSNPYTGGTCSGSTLLWDTDQYNSVQNFVDNQQNYILEYTPTSGGTTTLIGLSSGTTSTDTFFSVTYGYDIDGYITGYTLTLNDPDGVFNNTTTYSCNIRDLGETETPLSIITQLEEGCSLYDVPYDEDIVSIYYVGTGRTEYTAATLPPGSDITATKLSNNGDYRLPTSYRGDTYTPETPSGYSEFSNGVFYFVPGTQSAGRVFEILKEYRRRKRVGSLFCGGIVNYSFIDNWLSGSLYFFQFKAKVRWDDEDALDLNYGGTKYCDDIVYYKVSEGGSGDAVKRFYYRSCPFNYMVNPDRYGVEYTTGQYRLNRPTTMVDLGPRDEFIREICTDPSLDPNCSVSRSIGPTSFQSFGEIMGLAINYRMDTENNMFALDEFFDNGGFTGSGRGNKVLDGDLLQLISINNEIGIEEFNLQSPKYLGYSYQILDPESYPTVFKNGSSVWGPLPITFDFDADGQRVRACVNEPGRLTESSQMVPFFLWDKKGTGFGAYNDGTKDDQSWDYSSVQLQPLQGMTYGYTVFTGDTSDKYLLLPITYDFDGLTFTGLNVTNTVEFDVIETTDNHTTYDNQYPGFTYLYVSSGTVTNPVSGTLYTRYGNAGTWHTIAWDYSMDFIIRKTRDYYSGTKQILSTPFMFYFGLRPGNTGMDKFIKRFGPLGAFKSAE
jgi:hypothetical protein